MVKSSGLGFVLLALFTSYEFSLTLAQKAPPGSVRTSPPKPVVSLGALDIFTTPQARVTLDSGSGKKSKPMVEQADVDGKVSFSNLKSGLYAVRVDLEDHESRVERKIAINNGKTVTLRLDLIPRYSTLVIDLGDQAGPDVSVDINDAPISSERIELLTGKVIVKRVAVTGKDTCRIRVKKRYHEDYELTRSIEPTKENVYRIVLRKLTSNLTLQGNAGARIYLNGEDRGVLANDGKLIVTGLVTGDYPLRAQLFGFADLETKISIVPGKYEYETSIRLEPLVERAEISYQFQTSDEFPERPKDWKIENGKLTMAGAGTVLVRRNTLQSGQFSIFDKFTAILGVSRWNGKSLGWVIRAADQQSYHKVELRLAPTGNQADLYQLVLSNCQSGKCIPNDKYDLRTLTDILKNGDFRIYVSVSGRHIWHCISGGGSERPLGPTLLVQGMELGGVGLSGVEGAESTVNQLLILPGEPIRSKSCEPRRPNG